MKSLTQVLLPGFPHAKESKPSANRQNPPKRNLDYSCNTVYEVDNHIVQKLIGQFTGFFADFLGLQDAV